MNEQCANAETQPQWRRGRIASWAVICPVCGTLAQGATLSAVIDTEHAHRMAGEALRTDTPSVRPVRITPNGIRVG